MASLEDALDALPLFPLPDMTLFPGVPVALHVFEPRYREMLRHCLATHGALALVQLVPARGAVADPALPEIARVAGAGVIVRHEPLPDGRANIVVLGQARVRLEELPFEPPFRRARATVLHDAGAAVADTDRAALVSAATRFLAEIRKQRDGFQLAVPDAADAGELADFLAQQLVLDGGERQRMLECLVGKERVRLVTEALTQQTEKLFPRSERGTRVLN